MQQVLVIIIGVCVAVCALAMIAQIWAWVALAAAGMRIMNTVKDRVPHIKSARDSVLATFRENRDQVMHIADTSKQIAGVVKHEVALVNSLRLDATHRYQVERERAKMVHADVKHRTDEATQAVEHGISEPWRNVRELLRGIETGYREFDQEMEREHHRPAA